MTKSAYLAGPMRGLPYWNFPAFEAAAASLREQGWRIASPAEHDRKMGLVPVEDGSVEFPIAKCLEWDFQQIIKNDAIIVLPGWEHSTGVHWEFVVGYALDKPIYAYPGLEKIDPLPMVVTDPVGSDGDRQQFYDELVRRDGPLEREVVYVDRYDFTDGRQNLWCRSEWQGYRCNKRIGHLGQHGTVDPNDPMDWAVWEDGGDISHGLHPTQGVVAPRADEFAGCDIPEGWPERAWYDAYAGKELLVEPRQEEAVAEEVRVVDPETGGAKGQKDCRMGALDPIALEQMGLVAGMGEEKYDRFNFLKGYKWSLSIDALFRHLLAFLQGEDLDEESGLPHMAHAAWHAHALTGFLLRAIGTDDRAPAVGLNDAVFTPARCEVSYESCGAAATHQFPLYPSSATHQGRDGRHYQWVCETHSKGYSGVTLIGGEDTDA